MAGPAEILLLGDPRLRKVSEPVGDVASVARERKRLIATLEDFRRRAGFGRAIAAPQIGVAKRLIALDLGEGPFVVHDPEITWKSEETFTLWDDCMSFPDLLVEVRRHASISVSYTDEEGNRVERARLDRTTSELLQHEIDHLDGILAVDRATEPGAFRWRNARVD